MFNQPGAPPVFQQPGKPVADEYIPMNDLGKEIAARVKETFYAYNQRNADDNRTAQVHLGPSEIGTPCDRRLAMGLLGMPAVNVGGDGWAAFVGTAVHDHLAKMFEWANQGSGRYAVEVPLTFPSVLVPRGTGDLLDRTLCLFVDHKVMGSWSRKKLATAGPSDTYRVQVHTYAYGAKKRGEKVSNVAIIGWPRDGSSLDDLYVWTEKYDRLIAERGLKRVEQIDRRIKKHKDELLPDGEWARPRDYEVAERFGTARDCTYCPFYLSGSTSLEFGCKGVKA